MELTAIGIFLAGTHLAAVYLGTDVLHLEYPQLLALNVGITVVMALISRVMMPSWKPRVESALKQEARAGSAVADVGGMFLMFIIGAALSAALVYRRYGAIGWLGVVGSSALVNWLV